MPTVLKTTIDAALANGRLTLPETDQIIAAAGTTLTAAEANQIADVYDRVTGAAGAVTVTATNTAVRKLDALFVSAQVPFGGNKERMRQRLQIALENVPRGPQLAQAPRTASFDAKVTLRDARTSGGPRETLFINPVSQRAYLRSDGEPGAPKAKWFGPYALEGLAGARLVEVAPGQLSPDRTNWIRASVVEDLAHLAFDQASLPVTGTGGPAASGRFVSLGVLHATDAARFTVFVPEGTAGGSLDGTTRYVVRREAGSEPPRYTTLTDLPAFEDPATDGKVSPAMQQRARAQFYDREFGETHQWHTGAPPSSVKLRRSSVASYGDAYFVVGSAGGGPLKDPDAATAVYFRHRAADMWSGPFDIEPLYPVA